MKRFCLSLRAWVNLAAALLWVAGSVVARAQDIEPRAYASDPDCSCDCGRARICGNRQFDLRVNAPICG